MSNLEPPLPPSDRTTTEHRDASSPSAYSTHPHPTSSNRSCPTPIQPTRFDGTPFLQPVLPRPSTSSRPTALASPTSSANAPFLSRPQRLKQGFVPPFLGRCGRRDLELEQRPTARRGARWRRRRRGEVGVGRGKGRGREEWQRGAMSQGKGKVGRWEGRGEGGVEGEGVGL